MPDTRYPKLVDLVNGRRMLRRILIKQNATRIMVSLGLKRNIKVCNNGKTQDILDVNAGFNPRNIRAASFCNKRNK